jgi:hypothetical protein
LAQTQQVSGQLQRHTAQVKEYNYNESRQGKSQEIKKELNTINLMGRKT